MKTLSSIWMSKFSMYTPMGRESREVQGITIRKLRENADFTETGRWIPKSSSIELKFSSTFCRFSSWLMMPNASHDATEQSPQFTSIPTMYFERADTSSDDT